MWRILRIIVKPRKKFLLRISLTLLTASFIGAFFVHILSPRVDLPPIYEPISDDDEKERYIIDVELRWIENLAAQKQSIQYVYNRSTKSKSLLFKSKCNCRNWETISVEQINEQSDYSVYSINTRNNTKRLLYQLSREEFASRRFTCDLYSVFRRGKHQNVFSYNVFGKNSSYYYKIRDIAKQIKFLYPNWTIRVYSNGSLPKSILCKYECLLEDNIDFCLVDNVILRPYINERHVLSWNASYIQPTMWRFLPFGDSFIDVFASRDTDSYVIERERDSVDVWLKSGKLGHIMRDHPLHRVDILAGMWGFRFDKSRDLTEKIWERLIDRKIAKEYNPYKPNPYQSDQFWLKKYVWPEIINNSVIHDSYDCANHFGSSHWPTKRKGNCFVGAYGGCWEFARYFECPIECRPKDHLDWIYC